MRCTFHCLSADVPVFLLESLSFISDLADIFFLPPPVLVKLPLELWKPCRALSRANLYRSSRDCSRKQQQPSRSRPPEQERDSGGSWCNKLPDATAVDLAVTEHEKPSAKTRLLFPFQDDSSEVSRTFLTKHSPTGDCVKQSKEQESNQFCGSTRMSH